MSSKISERGAFEGGPQICYIEHKKPFVGETREEFNEHMLKEHADSKDSGFDTGVTGCKICGVRLRFTVPFHPLTVSGKGIAGTLMCPKCEERNKEVAKTEVIPQDD